MKPLYRKAPQDGVIVPFAVVGLMLAKLIFWHSHALDHLTFEVTKDGFHLGLGAAEARGHLPDGEEKTGSSRHGLRGGMIAENRNATGLDTLPDIGSSGYAAQLANPVSKTGSDLEIAELN